jgi:hypothetical protein
MAREREHERAMFQGKIVFLNEQRAHQRDRDREMRQRVREQVYPI